MQLLNVVREDRVTFRECWHPKYGLVRTLTCPVSDLPDAAPGKDCMVILVARSASREVIPWFCDKYAPAPQQPSNKQKRSKGRAA